MTGPGSADASRMRIAGIVLLAVAGVAAVVGLLALGGESPSSPAAAPANPTSQPLPGALSSPAPVPPNQAAVPQAGVAPGGPALAPGGAAAPGVGPAPAGGPAVGAPIVPGGAAGGAGAGSPPGVGGGGGPGGGAGGGSGANSAVEVRVFNNSTIQGLADRAAGQMRAGGWNVVEVGNYSGGVIPESTVYYRPGTGEEGAADAIAGQFGLRSMPRFDGIQGASPGVIVIATNNWGANQG